MCDVRRRDEHESRENHPLHRFLLLNSKSTSANGHPPLASFDWQPQPFCFGDPRAAVDGVIVSASASTCRSSSGTSCAITDCSLTSPRGANARSSAGLMPPACFIGYAVRRGGGGKNTGSPSLPPQRPRTGLVHVIGPI